MRTLLSPKMDIVFQHLFGKVGNEEITKEFISLIIERPIQGLLLDVSNRIEREEIDDKMGLLDVRAKLETGEDFNIEMQRAEYPDVCQRLLYYWSRLYGRKLKKGDHYSQLTPTIGILITDYMLQETKGFAHYHTVWNLRERK